MDIFSCDTMVALPNSTKSGTLIFAKNSDRPITEAQPLVHIEACDHGENERVRCTYIEIPQVAHTYTVMGSKPYWIWGFEHGMNEHNVVIGNEAVWSKDGEEETEGLLGMDLLRLGLERGKTAYEAMHVIISLLEQYGQGGNAAALMTHKYNNLFLIADEHEAWILETSKRRWIARRVKDVAGISNCYSTEEEWDEASDDIMEHAYENGWISRDVPFNFAKAYSQMSLKHRAAHPRFARLNKLLNQAKGEITIDTIRAIQRDHFEGEIIEPRWSPADGLHVSICMHAMMESASKTAAASHIELTGDENQIWWHACSTPCLSIFAPYQVHAELPDAVSKGGATFTEDSLWWKFERLQYLIERDYETYAPMWKAVAKDMEDTFRKNTVKAPTALEIRNNTEMMERAVDEMYEKLAAIHDPSNNPQHDSMIEIYKQRANIEC